MLKALYLRENEYFPEEQHSDFIADVDLLEKYLDGKAYQFGSIDGNHLFLSLRKNYIPHKSDVTIEILMYGLQGEAKQLFNSHDQTEINCDNYLALIKFYQDLT